SDMVRPCRAASRLSWAMTVSSTLRVVFIWETISLIWIDGQSLSGKPALICAHRQAAVEHYARHGRAEAPHRRHRRDDEHGGEVGDGALMWSFRHGSEKH